MTLSDVDAIAVSAGPGLAGCLAVGVSGAKSLAWAANKPIYGINHVIGHIAVTQLQFGPFPEDTLALIVSGGHTSLLHVEDVARHIDVVGTTLDDAAGECFDKVARLLGFPYPGGPHIDRHAQLGDPHAIKVPQGLTQGKAGQQHPYDFSFSGVKTAVARWIEEQQAQGNEIPVDDDHNAMIIVIDNADTLSDFSYKSDTIPVTSSSISSGRTEDTIFRSTSGDSIMRDISQSKIISIGNNDITINNVIVAAFVMT